MSFYKENPREYNNVHQWMLRNFKKTGICEFCFEEAKTQWSNKSGNYTRERIDWQELCSSCHMWYDWNVLKSHPRGLAPAPKYKDVKYGKREEVLARLRTYAWFREGKEKSA